MSKWEDWIRTLLGVALMGAGGLLIVIDLIALAVSHGTQVGGALLNGIVAVGVIVLGDRVMRGKIF